MLCMYFELYSAGSNKVELRVFGILRGPNASPSLYLIVVALLCVEESREEEQSKVRFSLYYITDFRVSGITSLPLSVMGML